MGYIRQIIFARPITLTFISFVPTGAEKLRVISTL
jgi:hypothetical protein